MIQEGCTNTCTYCKIYHARGTVSISKPPELVISEINEIGQKNCKEFILTGINLGDYAWEGLNLTDLLKKIDKDVHPDYRIRLSSLNPEDVTDELCEELKAKRFCPHLHLSVQSGSNQVLKRMNRKYQADTVIHAVEKLRAIDPLYSISCDIIVGFPGETEQAFKDLMQFAKNIRFDNLGVFTYSDSEDLVSHKLADHVSIKTARHRCNTLMACQKDISLENNLRHIGKTYDVLVDEAPEAHLFIGRTCFQAPEVDGITYVKADGLNIGDVVHVKITDALEYDLSGEPV